MKRRIAYQVGLVLAGLWVLPQAATAAGIATVVDVVNEGYRTPPGATELTAKSADELVQNEALRTEKESTIAVKFVDGSELSVEQSSEMVLSDYVYDGAASSGLINLNNGLFHFTSNGNNDQGVKLRTPVATIGVRGTEFLVHVDRDEATIIDILAGAVEATPHGTGKPITCYEGQSILIATENDDAQCGDIGSFSTAAGPGANEAEDDNGNNENKERGEGKERPEPPAPPAPEPEPECPDWSQIDNWNEIDWDSIPEDCDCGEWDYSYNFKKKQALPKTPAPELTNPRSKHATTSSGGSEGGSSGRN